MSNEFKKDEKRLELVKLNESAMTAIGVATAAATATGAVPIPFADAPLLVTEQVALMATICGIYGLKTKKETLTMLVSAVIGAGSSTIVGKTLFTNLCKLIPFAGGVVGGALSAGTAGVVTYAVGCSFNNICQMIKIGKLSEDDLSSDKVKDLMTEEFKKFAKKKTDEDKKE